MRRIKVDLRAVVPLGVPGNGRVGGGVQLGLQFGLNSRVGGGGRGAGDAVSAGNRIVEEWRVCRYPK